MNLYSFKNIISLTNIELSITLSIFVQLHITTILRVYAIYQNRFYRTWYIPVYF